MVGYAVLVGADLRQLIERFDSISRARYCDFSWVKKNDFFLKRGRLRVFKENDWGTNRQQIKKNITAK